MRVSIVGSGTVGQATGKGLSKYNHEIVFYDIDQQKLELLAGQGYKVANNIGAIRGCDIHIICVPTSTVDDEPSLAFLEAAVKEVAETLDSQDGYQVVVVRSTTPPFTIEKKIIPLLQRHCSLILGGQYGLCHNPEFLRENSSLDDFLNPPITVIGEIDERSGDLLAQLYDPFPSPKVRTTLENAEAIKCFSNVYNAMKISFFNKLYLIAEECGLNHEVISQSMPKSTTAIRLPEYGIRGGYPYGGKCLPKDLAAFTSFISEQGIDSHLFKVVAEINEEIKRLNPIPD
ncbi:NAD(P)-binding domain-containing protein [Chloroflexota bacterium]